MDASAVAALLARTEMFRDVPAPVLDQLAGRVAVRSLRRQQYLFYQGDSGDYLVVVASGLVKVVRTEEDGREIVLATIGPEESLGELAVIDGGPRSASIQAVEPSRVLTLGRAPLLEALVGHPEVADALLKALTRLVRRLIEQASDFVFLDLEARVAKLLLSLAGNPQAPGTTLDLNLTQSDIALMVGGSRQSVNQIVRSLAQRGALSIEGRTVTIANPDLLRKRAGG